MKTDHDDEPLLDNSPTDELPVLSEHDVVEDFDQTSVFVSLHEDTGRHNTARLPTAEDDFADTASGIEQGRRTDTYRVQGLPEDDVDEASVAADGGTNRREAREILRARLNELTDLNAVLRTAAGDKDASIASLEERLEATRQAVARRDETEARLRAQVAELQTRLAEQDDVLAEREARLNDADARLAAANAELTEREAHLARGDAHSAQLEARLTELDALAAERGAELAARDTRLAALETDLASRDSQLSARAADSAARDTDLARLDAELSARDERLAALVAELAARDTRVARLEAELADRDAGMAEQERRLEDRGRELEKLEAEREQAELDLQEARDAHAVLQGRSTVREQRHDENGGENDEASAASALRRSREDAAALAGYIENRRAHWDDVQKRLVEQRARMSELEHELEQRASRQREAVQRAAAESARVADLKIEVGKLRRLLDVRRRDPAPSIAVQSPPAAVFESSPTLPEGDRGSSAAPSKADHESSTAPPAADHEPTAALLKPDHEPTAAIQKPDHEPSTARREAGREPQPVREPGEAVTAPANDLPQFDSPRGELDRLRAEIDSLHAELASREAVLRERDEQQEDLRQRLTKNETQLDQARMAVGRLERIVVERDRALDVKKARIESLQAELTEKLRAGAPSAAAAQRARPRPAPDAEASRTQAIPTMVCLTDDAPRSYPLGKSIVTIGRSSQCDIQIATHFVSREHARISATTEGLVIEDLGSKNGVFVNSVRVERGPLQHGDLITIGETQFRLLRE